MASPRAERDALIVAADREIAVMQRRLARTVVASVRRHATATPDGPRITPLSRAQILIEVDAALDRVYGRVPGDTTAPLFRLIVRRSHAAALVPVDGAVRNIRYRLRGEPEVRAAIDRQAEV